MRVETHEESWWRGVKTNSTLLSLPHKYLSEEKHGENELSAAAAVNNSVISDLHAHWSALDSRPRPEESLLSLHNRFISLHFATLLC